MEKGANMVKKRFKLRTKISAIDDKEFALKDYYSSWRSNNRLAKSPFIALYNSFKDNHLKDLEAGPLRLYLFFTFSANNETGHSWHSITSIASFFETQTRTIDNWIKVLVEKDLIYREQKGKKSHTTYLVPYSNTTVQHKANKKIMVDSSILLDELVKKINELEFLYGEILKVHHIFQWIVNKGKVENSSVQFLFVITKRNNGVLIGHIFRLTNSDHLSVNTKNIEEVSIFKSPFTYNDRQVVGIALNHEISVNSKHNIDALLSLLEDLASIEDWELTNNPKVDYGEIDSFFSEENNKS